MLRSFAHAAVKDCCVCRRGFLGHLSAGAAVGALSLSWRDLLIAKADELKRQGRSMILLWMDGGPSQFDTFNPKIGSKYQGPSKAIQTNVSGVEFSEYWPKTAQVMDKIALIRSMKSEERDHFRAIKLVKTGYAIKPTIAYPTWGSVVARDRYDPGFDLPAFVRIGKPRIKTRDVNSGVLGPRFESFKVDEPAKLPDDVVTAIPPDVLKRRLALSGELDAEFAKRGGGAQEGNVNGHLPHAGEQAAFLPPEAQPGLLEQLPGLIGKTAFAGYADAKIVHEQGSEW